MKGKTEFEEFNDVMDRLLAVPYSELKKKLDEEKQNKKAKKDGHRSISDVRVSQRAKRT